jgi:hypothetical protein
LQTTTRCMLVAQWLVANDKISNSVMLFIVFKAFHLIILIWMAIIWTLPHLVENYLKGFSFLCEQFFFAWEHHE